MISLSGHSVLAVLCSPSPIMQAKLFDQDKPRHCSELFDDWESCPPVAPGKPALFAAAPVPDASPPVARVRNLLESRPGECFPLEALAERAGYSPWHFARLFKRETGFAPHAFQLVCRLSLARDMLRKGTAAVETAVSTGFSDQSHLHKFFKLHHGLTPKQFVMACVAL
jgi:transcriptional regulator GlxA family with amidase domain